MKASQCRVVCRGLLMVVCLLLTPITYVGSLHAQEAKKFTLINVIFDGTKIWLPSSLIVHEGDTVELTLINKLDEPHGFQIAAFGIEEVVQPKAQTNVRFTATKAGLSSFICHIHPPHIGGQILVLKKE
jgi:heme/copper-type cytochrome/quinol oxidase subunit 2